jgi:Icc-related predicted phosphoesterase
MGPDYRSNRYHDFMQRCSARFPHVILIAGNHEHYNGDFAKTVAHIKDVLAYLKNVHVLEKQSVDIMGVTFVGATLWTDMNREDPETLGHIKRYMNDYRIIENSAEPVSFRKILPRDRPVGMTDQEWLSLPDEDRTRVEFGTRTGRFTPMNSVDDHKAALAFIQQTVDSAPDKMFVVVGHHSPSRRSTKPQYAKDVHVNGAYSSDLEDFIQARPQIRLWTHGHTHHEFDYMVGATRVVCNPRGYIGHEPEASNWKLKTVEV